jgi:hypothetical protein
MAHPTGKKLAAALVVGIVTVQALMLFAFAWPASNSGPREVPIAVAGPDQVAGQLEQALAAAPGADADTAAFDVEVVADAATAENAILDRDVYGALVATPQGAELLIATGASPAVAQMLRNAAAEMAPDGVPLTVRDVVPATSDDPAGAGLAAGVLPLVMTSAIAGLASVLLLRRASHRTGVVIGLSTVAGLVGAALIQPLLGVTDGSYWALAGVIALLVGAVSASVAGLGAVLGRAGGVLGVLLALFVGNPLSAAANAPEMLPQPWGALGQLMPPGAGVSGVRSVGFFDAAAIGTPLVVLSTWLVAGLALVWLGGLIGRRGADVEPVAVRTGEPATVHDRGETADRSS